ncbi:MAG TPA: NFACT RNA binding domain-containing protein [Myxococcaceae bacterium]|nr:NFACT RNA binding domain-containing protein [Myxococcaceae bacterium]
MSLRARELAEVVDELSASLPGSLVQKAFLPEPALCYLELRHRSRSVLLCLCVARDRARISVAESGRPSSEPALPFQQQLRRELIGSTLARIAREGVGTVTLDFRNAIRSRRLIADFGARDAKLVLLGDGERILGISSQLDRAKSGLKPGGIYPPPSGEATAHLESGASSRLVSIPEAPFPLAQAAEALYGEKDEQLRTEEILRRLLRSLKKKIERIERTREKVLGEAARGAQAEQHRRIGELVSQNLHRIQRGDMVARLTEYTQQGPVEVEVPLHPERSPKQEAEWHFHQYRRLLRGSERASARLAELDEELTVVRRDMERWQSASAEALLRQPEPPTAGRRKPLSRSRPYKEYFSSKGQRIWVGRDSRTNDELTFKVARPEDLWLHARGASGSHVVVPLEKKAEISSELLVDAAHLALHHSSLKGEPRGEIIYVKAKHVRRRKGDPAGAVNVEREKSLTVRIDPERLAKLLSSRARGSID